MASTEETIEDSVVDRLKTRIPTMDERTYPSVSVQEDAAHISQQPPTIFVQVIGSVPAAQQPAGCPEKRRREFTVGVMYVAEKLRVTDDARATVGLHELKQLGREALQGWKPDGACSGMEEGEEMEIGNDDETLLLVWQQEWTVRAIVTATP